MTIQYINTGSSANAGNGDSLRSAFIKVNNNFAYLSTASFGGGPTGPTGDIGPTGPAGVGTVITGQKYKIPYYGNTGTILSPISPMHFIPGSTSTYPVLQIGEGVSTPIVAIIRNGYNPLPEGGFVFAQYHNVVDATNFTFFRGRGTYTAPANLQNGDDIIDLVFSGHNNTASSAAIVSVTVEGNPTVSGQIPAKYQIGTNNGTSTRYGAELSSSSTWKIDKLSHLSTSTSSITISTNLIPNEDNVYNLGSYDNQWHSLYVSSSTVYINRVPLTIDSTNKLFVNGSEIVGQPGLVWRGAWQEVPHNYVGGQDVVSYNGSSYIKLGDGNSGSSPDVDTVRWAPVALKGADGSRFQLSSSTVYVTLTSDGLLTLPNSGLIDFNSPYTRLKNTVTGQGAQLGSPDDQNYVNVDNTAVTIQVNSDGVTGPHTLPQHNWIFGQDGTIVSETGRNITGELSGQTDSGNYFSNQPIAIKHASGYKRLINVNGTAQTWITLNDLGTQLGINPGWINGAIIEYQAFACGYSWQGSMVGQIIIASNQNYQMNVSHTETAITNGGGNPADVTFSNLDLWHMNGGALQVRRTDSGSGQQLDITWTARVFVNASENYC
jgi:hypothetical protein